MNPEFRNQDPENAAGEGSSGSQESSLPNEAAEANEAKDQLSLEQQFYQLVGAVYGDNLEASLIRFDAEEYAEQLSIEECMLVFQYLLQHDPQFRFLSPRSWQIVADQARTSWPSFLRLIAAEAVLSAIVKQDKDKWTRGQ